MHRPFLLVDRGCPWGACLLGVHKGVRKAVDYLAVGGNDVIVVGVNQVFATTAVDGVRSAHSLENLSFDIVDAVSAADQIGALLAFNVIGATFSVEFVVAALAEQHLFVRRRVGPAMQLVAASGALQNVIASPAVHHVRPRVALPRGRWSSNTVPIREEVDTGATIIGVVAVFAVQLVVPIAAPERVGGGFCIHGVIPAQGLDEVGIVGAV